VGPVTTLSAASFAEAHGARIPMIGLGTVRFSGPDSVRLVSDALRIGYRHLDTAQNYGSEPEVGEGLQTSGIRRDEVFVTTKINPPNMGPEDLIRTTKESLTRLRLSEVDLLLLHWMPPQPFTLAGTLEALSEAKRLGLTRHIGVSNFNIAGMEEAVRVSPEPLVCNQIEIHPYLDQTKVIAACRRLGFAVVAHCPIARGAIFGDPVIERIAKAHDKSAAQVTLRWLLQQGIVIIPRSSKLDRAAENFDVFGFELSAAEMAAIDGLKRPGSRLIADAKWAKTWPYPWAPVWDD
jgi:diketogulonate reductase-like aldo/keto reductase